MTESERELQQLVDALPQYENQIRYWESQLEAISKLPSREILISQFLSVINQPAVKFLYAAKSIPSSLVNVLNNLKDKK